MADKVIKTVVMPLAMVVSGLALGMVCGLVVRGAGIAP